MPAADFSFSGAVREIIINPGVTSVNVQDMYSRWKQWVTETDNTKYLQAFNTFGGDPTIPGQFAPRYFFLTNGWKVRVNNNEDVDFQTNLYTDDVGQSPFIVGSGSSVSNRNSDAAVVDDTISESLDYAGIVNINQSIGVSGTTYPIGTIALPVNNLTDAKIIANDRGFITYRIFGNVTFDVDLLDSVVIGGNILDVISATSVNLGGSTFKELCLDGTYNGYISADKCLLQDNLSGMSGHFTSCGIGGNLNFKLSADTLLFDCHSMTPNKNTTPKFNLNYDTKVKALKYTGGVIIDNSLSGSETTFDFVAGQATLLSGNTDGNICLRGLSDLINNASTAVTLDTIGIMIPINVQQGININTELLKNK